MPTASKPSIDELWHRLKIHEGQEFETIRGERFTYSISGNTFLPSRTKYNISRADFDKALSLAPFEGPGAVNDAVRGPSYIWAVLHDKRIRRHDW